MNLFPLIRPLLFALDAESAHEKTFKGLDYLESKGLLKNIVGHIPSSPRTFCGLQLPNPVGLAAGLDKDGKHIDALAALGFGFLEIGTVTPLPQPGNPKPRLFRLPQSQGIINRMGFNNDGVKACVQRVRESKFYQNGGIIGLNIGKNAATPIEEATNDYLIGLREVYGVASYVTINISSPNTKNLRQLQEGNELEKLLQALSEERERLSQAHGKRLPMFLKIAPDLVGEQIKEISDLIQRYQFDAIIATNTTLSRYGVEKEPNGGETGGLSGAPVKKLSTQTLEAFAKELQGKVPLIGVGGILSGLDAKDKIVAGASVVQLYSGLIYKGPELIKECIQALR
jgi:dihydroorotate dehydrogenase